MKGFISYAHADQAMFQAFHTHLKGIERVLDVRFWADTGIGGGAHWNDEIAKAIAEADIFVLLLSPDWLASEYIEKYEEPAIRARYNPKTGLICPVILRRCDWTDIVPDLQGIPTHGRKVVPIDDWRPKEHGYDAARAEINAEIRARFNLSSRPAEWRQRLDGGPQKQPAIVWVQENDQLVPAAEGAEADDAVAADASTQRSQGVVRNKADTLARLANQLGNRLDSDWTGIAAAAREFADEMAKPTKMLAAEIDPLWHMFLRLSLFLAMDERAMNRRNGETAPLPAPLHRALSDLVGSAAPWLRRFPTARGMDDQRRASGADRADMTETMGLAEALIAAARDEPLIPSSAAKRLSDSVKMGQDPSVPGDKAAAESENAIYNLFVKMGSTAAGAMLGDLRFGSEADRALHGHIKHVLRAIEDHPRIGAYLKARFPDDLRHAFEQLMREAKESPGAFEIPPEREEGSGPSVAGPDMVRIPAGKFMMGVPQEESDGPEGWGASDDDSRPVHEVTFARPFLLGKYPVTVGEYAAFAGDTGRTPEPPAFPQTDRHPAVNVSFAGAVAYTEWLSERTGLRYRLPSEAEWEYACRAGTTTARWWGDGFDPSKANKNDQGTTAVDHYDPNPWGLHDTIGNVFEWVADPMHDNYVDAPSDGSVWTTGGSDDSRVVRGGAWDNGVRVLRSGYRYWNLDGARPWVGFRLARTL